MSWREETLEPGITAVDLGTSVATQRATTTPGDTLNFLSWFIQLLKLPRIRNKSVTNADYGRM